MDSGTTNNNGNRVSVQGEENIEHKARKNVNIIADYYYGTSG